MNRDIKQTALSDLAEITKELDKIASERLELENKEATLNKREEAWKVILGDDFPSKISRAIPKFRKNFKKLDVITGFPFWKIVKEAASSFDNEFDTPAIENWLIINEKVLPIKQPRARIKMALKQLEDKGYVIKTFEPKQGIEPHRYKVTTKIFKS